MDQPAAPKTIRFNPLLPYWAVFQLDLRQTLRSWIYQAWMFLTVAAAAGYLLYSLGAKQEAGWVMPAHNMISELLRWVLWGSATLIIVLAAGTICSERGNIADAVLCRGISRYQYFLGKWHARLFAVLAMFFLLAGITISAAAVLLHGEHLHLVGCIVALSIVATILVLVISCGVSISALASNTVVSIAIVWLLLYGGGFLLSFLPERYPSPDRVLRNLPNILRGMYDGQAILRLIGGTLAVSCFVAFVGMINFSRRDV
jgi:ABC-2 type transport system permease protein